MPMPMRMPSLNEMEIRGLATSVSGMEKDRLKRWKAEGYDIILIATNDDEDTGHIYRFARDHDAIVERMFAPSGLALLSRKPHGELAQHLLAADIHREGLNAGGFHVVPIRDGISRLHLDHFAAMSNSSITIEESENRVALRIQNKKEADIARRWFGVE